MRAAFAYWKDRIAPVFDTARLIRLVDTENHRALAQTEEILEQELPQLRAERLVELRVDTLVCGAITRQLEVLIAASGIEVIPFVSGELETVIEAFFSRRLRGDSFKMPGCGRLRHRGKRGLCGNAEVGRTLPGQWRIGKQDSGKGSVAPPAGARHSFTAPEGRESVSGGAEGGEAGKKEVPDAT